MRYVLPILLLWTVSCAPAGTRAARNADVLTQQEIEESDQLNAYDLVRTLRPNWLRTRGRSSIYHENPIMVYVDGNRMGGVEMLSTVATIAIEEIRYYSPSEAHSRFGLNHTNGAIAVTTRRG